MDMSNGSRGSHEKDAYFTLRDDGWRRSIGIRCVFGHEHIFTRNADDADSASISTASASAATCVYN
jgi:hypothetical protein